VGALVLAAAIVGLGLFFLVGAFAVPGEASYAGVGPRAFPILIGAGLTGAGLAYAWQAARGQVAPVRAAGPVDRGALLWIAGGLALAVAVIQALGFALTSGLLFATTARGFGSRRPARDAAVGLVLGTVVYLAFARLLGVSLPGGVLDRWP
jgi:putative tricarboxylic transport membrane protein